MSVYFIVYQNITDSERFAEYVEAVMPEIAKRNGKLIAHGKPEAVEGSLNANRAVVFEWPSRKELLDFWHSDEYAEIKKLREGAAQWQAVIIEGVGSSS